jgi:ATP-binding cassette subfamily F protein 3
LIKLLAGEISAQAGEVIRAKDLDIGYFAQHQLEQLRCDETPFLHMQTLAPLETEQSLCNYLGGFGFVGDRVNEQVEIFSGGEKARLVLAMLAWQRPNLLLLDEPTNHFDIEMRHALSMALQDYEGAMVIVSHDRHMLRSVCDDFLLVADGQVMEFDGDLDDYRQWLNRRLAESDLSGQAENKENSAQSKKLKRQQQAENRKRLQPLQNKLNKLENELEQVNARLEQLESELSDPALYQEQSRDKLKNLLADQGQLKSRRDAVEEAWFEAGEELHAAEKSIDS